MELEFEKNKVTKQQEYWQQKAIELAASQKKDMGLINNDGSYQVWPLNKCGNNVLFMAKYIKDGVNYETN